LLDAGGTTRLHRGLNIGVRIDAAELRRRTAPNESNARAFLVSRQNNGRYRIRIRVGPAATVELAGDCTNWQPRGMRRVTDDDWEIELPVLPGVHHVNIRVDGGAWRAPPGLVQVSDDFAGMVGMFVVE
jgi:hypothetical protein